MCFDAVVQSMFIWVGLIYIPIYIYIYDRFVNVAVWLITSIHNAFFCSAPSSTSSPLSFSPLLLTEPLSHSKVQNANQLATTCSNARRSPTPTIPQATPFQIPLCPTKSETRTWNLIRMKRKRKKRKRKNPPPTSPRKWYPLIDN